MTDGGDPSGISIYLWDKVAEQLGLYDEIELFDRKEFLSSVAQGKTDVAASYLSITQEHGNTIDFSHSLCVFPVHMIQPIIHTRKMEVRSCKKRKQATSALLSD